MSSLSESRKRLEKEKATLDKDWGRDWEWKKLDGTCVEKDTGECVARPMLMLRYSSDARTGIPMRSAFSALASKRRTAVI